MKKDVKKLFQIIFARLLRGTKQIYWGIQIIFATGSIGYAIYDCHVMMLKLSEEDWVKICSELKGIGGEEIILNLVKWWWKCRYEHRGSGSLHGSIERDTQDCRIAGVQSTKNVGCTVGWMLILKKSCLMRILFMIRVMTYIMIYIVQ